MLYQLSYTPRAGERRSLARRGGERKGCGGPLRGSGRDLVAVAVQQRPHG